MNRTSRPATEGIYRRVTVRMYGDERFMRLTPLQPSGQALWFYLLTGPHTGQIPGVFVAGRAALAEALGWNLEGFQKAFAEVLHEGLAEFDEKTRMCFVPNAIYHNTPPNPNVVKSWRAAWLQLPECSLRDRVFNHLKSALTEVSPAFSKAFEDACGKTFEKPSVMASAKHTAKQEQEQEQKKVARKRASVAFDAALMNIPEWLPRESWAAWVSDRNERSKPITQRGAAAQIAKLDRHRTEGHQPAEVIENSIACGYQGLFPPSGGTRASGDRAVSTPVLDSDEVFEGIR